MALADFSSQPNQILLVFPLIHHKEDVDLVQRIDRLHGDVVGIAGADADDEEFFHGRFRLYAIEMTYRE